MTHMTEHQPYLMAMVRSRLRGSVTSLGGILAIVVALLCLLYDLSKNPKIINAAVHGWQIPQEWYGRGRVRPTVDAVDPILLDPAGNGGCLRPGSRGERPAPSTWQQPTAPAVPAELLLGLLAAPTLIESVWAFFLIPLIVGCSAGAGFFWKNLLQNEMSGLFWLVFALLLAVALQAPRPLPSKGHRIAALAVFCWFWTMGAWVLTALGLANPMGVFFLWPFDCIAALWCSRPSSTGTPRPSAGARRGTRLWTGAVRFAALPILALLASMLSPETTERYAQIASVTMVFASCLAIGLMLYWESIAYPEMPWTLGRIALASGLSVTITSAIVLYRMRPGLPMVFNSGRLTLATGAAALLARFLGYLLLAVGLSRRRFEWSSLAIVGLFAMTEVLGPAARMEFEPFGPEGMSFAVGLCSGTRCLGDALKYLDGHPGAALGGACELGPFLAPEVATIAVVVRLRRSGSDMVPRESARPDKPAPFTAPSDPSWARRARGPVAAWARPSEPDLTTDGRADAAPRAAPDLVRRDHTEARWCRRPGLGHLPILPASVCGAESLRIPIRADHRLCARRTIRDLLRTPGQPGPPVAARGGTASCCAGTSTAALKSWQVALGYTAGSSFGPFLLISPLVVLLLLALIARPEGVMDFPGNRRHHDIGAWFG